MYAQAAIKSNTLLRNGAYGIVMREVQICTRCACASLCAFGCFVRLYQFRYGNRQFLWYGRLSRHCDDARHSPVGTADGVIIGAQARPMGYGYRSGIPG